MNPQLQIIRLEKSTDGVLGVLKINGRIFCCTLEPEDLNNTPKLSCIPVGKYTCKRYHSIKYPDTYIIRNVPDRDLILFHSGNTEEDTKGCVLLGQYFDKLKGKRAILNSGATFKNFLTSLSNFDILDLEIKECF